MINDKLLNVLLVDDDETTNFMNTRMLKKSGILQSIHVAENGKEALDYLTCQGPFSHATKFPKPDLILLDINMPVMNGWEFLEQYNQLEETKKGQVIVVMLTTSLQKEDHEKANNSGIIRELVNKPLDKRALLQIIEANFKNEV